MKIKQYLTKSNLGLVVGIAGAVLLALAVGLNPCGRTGQTCGYEFAYVLHPYYFKIGMGLIITGFILQIKKKINQQSRF